LRSEVHSRPQEGATQWRHTPTRQFTLNLIGVRFASPSPAAVSHFELIYDV